MSHSRKYFGTDGIRAPVGEYPMIPEFIIQLGRAAGHEFSTMNHNQVVIGHDGRRSAQMIQSALIAGLASAGVDSVLVGLCPTPTVAYLTKHHKAQAGIVISASHNSYKDNGIKFFSASGGKLSDQIEWNIEHSLKHESTLVEVDYLGGAVVIDNPLAPYHQFCLNLLEETDLSDLKVVIDCANGATSTLAPALFKAAGLSVIAMHDQPSGVNINAECGSTHITGLQERVVTEGAQLGIAFDGDGDRVMMVDHKGDLVDGDELLYIIAHHAKQRGEFSGGVVGTQMSNFGLERAFNELDIPFVRTNVGDRFVLQELNRRGWQVGGEASGHIMCLQDTTTGDGVISAIRVLQAIVQSGKPLHELKQGMRKVAQCLINVSVPNAVHAAESATVLAAMELARDRLEGNGRVLIRPSGTEPVVRVMVECDDPALLESLAAELAQVVTQSSQ